MTQSAKLLLLGCRTGALAVHLANRFPDADLQITDTSFIAQEMSNMTLRENRIRNVSFNPTILLDRPVDNQFDNVIIHLPKGRKTSQRWILVAFLSLKPNGYLYLAGPNDRGIQTVIKDAISFFGNGQTIQYKHGNRIAVFQKTAIISSSSPPWATEAGIFPGTWRQWQTTVASRQVTLFSLPGVFSYEHIDPGTILLLDSIKIGSQESVIDLGCGYGVIGIAAALLGAQQVRLIDVDLVAIHCAQKAITENNIPNATAFASDGLANYSGEKVTTILTNPPFHSGKEVDYGATSSFIRDGAKLLAPGGRFILVANSFLRYERLLKEFFPKVSILASTPQYHVLCGEKTTGTAIHVDSSLR